MTLNKHILLVEDQEILAMMTQAWLEDMGVTVTTVENGIKAKPELINNHFDLIMTDLLMPELDGLGLLQWMQEKSITTPTMVISGISDPEQLAKLRKFPNVIQILEKPLTMDQLIDVQHYILG